jgi:TldD protein
MPYNRRNFLKTSSLAAAGIGLSRNIIPDWRLPASAYYPDDDPAEVKKLVSAGLDTAKAAGASYCDVRVTRTRGVAVAMNKMDVQPPGNVNQVYVGVRVIVENVWGFASFSTRSVDEVAELARTAVEQAKINSWSGKPPVDLAPAPVVSGNWSMPIQREPLDVPIEEIIADITAGHEVANKFGKLTSFGTDFEFYRTDKTFGNSEGSYVTQRTYESFGGSSYSMVMMAGDDPTDQAFRLAGFIWPHGAGYEIVKAANFPARMQEMIEEVKALAVAPPVEVGQYDIVLDGQAMCSLVGQTYGNHSQIDRALGFEANAGGTSWVAPPEEKLGKLKWGTDAVTVKANRNHPMSPVNLKWDDEGVETEEFTIIDKGIFVDYQTTREQVAWMKDYYAATKRPMKSHGCAWAGDASNIQMQRQPNVILQPASADTKLDDLLTGIDKGMLFLGGSTWTDHQGMTGQGGSLAMCYEIRKGKRARLVRDATFMFQTEEMFKKIVGIGGQSTYHARAAGTFKGQPMQILAGFNASPAVRFKDQKVTTLRGRAI